MGRTICKKHDEDIDNCPLQEGSHKKKVWNKNNQTNSQEPFGNEK